MPKKDKPATGYSKKKKTKESKHSYIGDLIIPGKKKISLTERIIKFLIFLALRIVIKPSKWKNPKKNYELIDRIYRRLVGSDMIFIPSSIAYYIIVAFMPILSLIVLATQIPGIDSIFTKDNIKNVLGKFIPGIGAIIENLFSNLHTKSTVEHIGGISGTIVILLISTWIASGGFAKLIYTQSFLYGHKFVGGWWMNKLKGMFLVFSLAIFLLIALLINIKVESSIDSLSISATAKSAFMYTFLILGLFFLLTSAMIAMFKLSPRFKVRLRHVIPGAVVTALPTTIFLSIFAIYAKMSSYSAYGIISILMYIGLVALWLSNFVFLGVITNAAYYKTHVSELTRKKWTISKK